MVVGSLVFDFVVAKIHDHLSSDSGSIISQVGLNTQLVWQ